MVSRLNREQYRTLSELSLVQFLRLTGIFFVIPLIGVYASKFTQNGILIGLALASYEISMAVMQIPSGYLSRIIGRKNYIYLGLSLFILGNILSYAGNNIWLLITGRFIAGLGAISTPITSMAIDSVPEDRRNTAMTITGIGIGFAFMGGIGFSPLIATFIGVRNFFLISAILGIGAIFIITRIKETKHTVNQKHMNETILKHKDYLIYTGAFLVSSASFMIFLSVQIYAVPYFGLFQYGLILFLSVLISGIIAVTISEGVYRIRKFNVIGLSSVLIFVGITTVYLGLIFHLNYILYMIALIPFFTGFSIYEIVIIPLLAGVLSNRERNLSFGIFYAFQYSGNGIGAILEGALLLFLRGNYLLPVSFTTVIIIGTVAGLFFVIASSGVYKIDKAL